HAARVDVDDGGAAAELTGDLGDQVRVLHGRGVDTHLLGPRLNEASGVVKGADAAADGERHENLLGNAADHVEHDGPALVARGNVEKDQFICAIGLVAPGDLDGIAGVAQLQEVDALDHAATVHIQTGNDALGEHAAGSVRRSVLVSDTLCSRRSAVNWPV